MENSFQEIKELDEFQKDLIKLSKRYKTLPDDLKLLINTSVFAYHKLGQDNKGIFQIPDLGIEYLEIYKVTKFACKALPGKGVMSGLRITYAYFKDEDRLELIEIYYKGKKENEDRDRIKKNYKNEDI